MTVSPLHLTKRLRSFSSPKNIKICHLKCRCSLFRAVGHVVRFGSYVALASNPEEATSTIEAMEACKLLQEGMYGKRKALETDANCKAGPTPGRRLHSFALPTNVRQIQDIRRERIRYWKRVSVNLERSNQNLCCDRMRKFLCRRKIYNFQLFACCLLDELFVWRLLLYKNV